VFQGWPTRYRSCFLITPVRIRSRQADHGRTPTRLRPDHCTNAIFDDQQPWISDAQVT
jgi:hypothetical protein